MTAFVLGVVCGVLGLLLGMEVWMHFGRRPRQLDAEITRIKAHLDQCKERGICHSCERPIDESARAILRRSE